MCAIYGSLLRQKAAPCVTSICMESVMKFFRFLKSVRPLNPTTVRERQRLAATMPGQMGAVTASRHGIFV
jgi:hypothetical protein